ncbi:hypothetical protein F8M41_008065 [Gigaspora margarita]|uniref:G-protein coupled receptors family 1 profile domain-containing protein n=1 Tax=Gigaspora margarita TaxID=4874 RepID=A0A8H4AW30_GIGMA|nr:hypothetical protein F8M41_008065 [Gigaspora margarita]
MLNRIYHKWAHNHKSLSMALRVPFYLCIFDIILVFFLDLNLTYLAIHRITWPVQTCKIIAVVAIAFTLIHRLFVACIAVITYLRVCKQKACDTGRYDWKLFLPLVIVSSLISIAGLQTYGPVKYWCAAESKTMVNPISSTLMTITVLSTCSFCYIQTIREIRSIKKQQATITTSQNITIFPVTDVELRVSVKVLGYILVFIVQWIPDIPYDMYQFYGTAHPWAYCFVVFTIIIGPIGNLIFFIINEGWSRDQTNLSSGYADVKCESGDSNYNSSSTNGNKSHESDFN